MTSPSLDRRALIAAGLSGATALLLPARALALAPPTRVRVQTRSGLVSGQIVDGVRTFTAIPFGHVPGRFRAPVAAPAWRDPFDATRPPAVPPQASGMVDRSHGQSEQCLQLNVWAPVTPGPHPVLVWVYGGGNEGGWCGDPENDGRRFAADGIVFVGFNYRVGAPGFLELGALLGGDYAGSGNNGVRDQILALRWVRDNITAFGGNPHRVTLAGQSAGAKNVGTLLAVDQAAPLFRQAMMSSGGGTTVHDAATATAFATMLAGHIGGAERLRTAPIADLIAAQVAARQSWNGGFPFRPVIDGDLLTARPIDRIAAGSGRRKPLLIGSNKDESRLFVPERRAAAPLTAKLLANMTVQRASTYDRRYAEAFPQLSVAERHWRLLTAEEYGIPTLRVATAHAATRAPVYRYRFDYPAPGGPAAGFSPHALDLPFWFDRLETPLARNAFGLRPDDRPLAARLHASLVAFVRDGTPAPIADTAWPRFVPNDQRTVVIDRQPSVAHDLDPKETAIWSDWA